MLFLVSCGYEERGKGGVPQLPSPAPSSLGQVNMSGFIFFPSDSTTRHKTKLKKAIFCSHEIFSSGKRSGKHSQHSI